MNAMLRQADAGGAAPEVSVIVVNYNGERFMRVCLQSLAIALEGVDHEVIVVDNASADASCALIESEFPRVRLLRSERNLGFTGGNNLGARAARSELLLLLNNDTRCLGSLRPLLAALRDGAVGAAGCTLRYADGRLQHSVGFEHTPARIVLSWLGLARFGAMARCFKRVETDAEFYRRDRPRVDWVSGACLLTRRSLWRRLGGFDESFFMYCEDVDYCRRVRREGYAVAYASGAAVLHYEGAGRLWAGERTLLRTSRSYLLYVSKHFGHGVRVGVGLGLGAVFLARSVCYGARALLGRNAQLPREKFLAYARAARFLVGAGLGLRDLGAQL